ncbi:MAG: hypothetical protein LLG02_05745 [Pelosinus sp.]|nr:hypothetical protein [Pelosinus sp.]
MTKYGGESNTPSKISQLIQKRAHGKQSLRQELKSSGSIDNPIKYTETHLEGGIEADF